VIALAFAFTNALNQAERRSLSRCAFDVPRFHGLFVPRHDSSGLRL